MCCNFSLTASSTPATVTFRASSGKGSTSVSCFQSGSAGLASACCGAEAARFPAPSIPGHTSGSSSPSLKQCKLPTWALPFRFQWDAWDGWGHATTPEPSIFGNRGWIVGKNDSETPRSCKAADTIGLRAWRWNSTQRASPPPLRRDSFTSPKPRSWSSSISASLSVDLCAPFRAEKWRLICDSRIGSFRQDSSTRAAIGRARVVAPCFSCCCRWLRRMVLSTIAHVWPTLRSKCRIAHLTALSGRVELKFDSANKPAAAKPVRQAAAGMWYSIFPRAAFVADPHPPCFSSSSRS